MGRGDKRSRKGKIFAASYGNTRKRKTTKKVAPKTTATAAKKAPAKKGK
jgi:30S ribosomal protein S31